MKKVKRVILIVLDSVGIGALPDAAEFGDAKTNTIKHIAEHMGHLNLPCLGRLGLGNIEDIKGVNPEPALGVFGKMAERSQGKDTTTGHWEISGIVLKEAFPTFPDGFPRELMSQFEAAIGRKTIGNYPASGTAIIDELGEEHVKTGQPIVYTSADSVFQIAAHEEIIPIEELYAMCKTARKLLTGPYAVGRVIARPFIGTPGKFTRTTRREDFSLEPTTETVLDNIKNTGLEVMGVGKIIDIFAGKGITQSNHTVPNMESVDATLDFMKQNKPGLIFANLVEFDMVYGHRRDVEGYAHALEQFDTRLPEIMDAMQSDDVLIITADHGCDPTHTGTDHTREYIPIMIYGEAIKENLNLGVRTSFADIAATIADLLEVKSPEAGESFAKDILK